MKFNDPANRIFDDKRQHFPLCKRISRVVELILAALIVHLSERIPGTIEYFSYGFHFTRAAKVH